MDTMKAIRPYRILKFRRIIRCVEACAALVLLSWSSLRLPVVATTSEHFLADVLLNPRRFVFLLGNAIVLVLFAKSGHLFTSSSAAATGGDLSDNEQLEIRDRIAYVPTPSEEVRDDEEVRVEIRRSEPGTERREMKIRLSEPATERREKEIRRSERREMKIRRSELATERREMEILRSELEVGLKVCDDEVPAPEGWEFEGREMTVEDAGEFRRTIDSFIAEHLRFQIEEEEEESLATVSSAGPPELEILKFKTMYR